MRVEPVLMRIEPVLTWLNLAVTCLTELYVCFRLVIVALREAPAIVLFTLVEEPSKLTPCRVILYSWGDY